MTLGALTRISAQGTYSWEIRSGDCRQRIHTDREDGLYGVFMPPVGLIATALGSAIYSLPEWPENLYCRGEGMLQCYDADSLPVDWPWQKEAISALKECPW
ncbi:MAG: hypothetical protein HS115_11175 [Spirochaetales bacterium]|nr:hypothetical protein [Spirochaetales bacterium]